MYADSEEIVKCCIALKQMVKDMVTELQQETRLQVRLYMYPMSVTNYNHTSSQVYKIADGMTTKSELLKKNAHLHHKSPLGNAMCTCMCSLIVAGRLVYCNFRESCRKNFPST